MNRFAGNAPAERLVRSLYSHVGGFFRNTRRGSPLTCVVCTGPASATSSPPVGLGIGPAGSAPRSSTPVPGRFFVPNEYRPQVAGQHVLVVEDTWVSGGKAQSAALALKAAGAARVTILSVTRWLRYDWPDHRALIETLTEPCDARRRPVTGTSC